MRRIIAFVFAFNALVAAAQPAFVKDSLDAFVEREMKRWQVPGLALAIVKDGKIVRCQGYGVRDFRKSEPVNELTLFQIASNSKAFTGTAIAHLNYEKRLSLDEKVSRYLPYFKLYDPASTDMCTVRDVLCHRLGMQTFQGDFLNWGSKLSRKEIVEHMALTKPVHPFRYKYGYCNAGYITAGEVILAVTDTVWDDFIDARYFKPLGMKHTSSRYKDMVSDANACVPHSLVRGKLVAIKLTNIDNMGASASINSCVADMANWLLMQLDSGRFNGKQVIPFPVLAETRRSNMIVNDVRSPIFKTKHFSTYGLGWSSYDYEGRRVWEHSGGANGFVTKTEFIPEENLGILVYTNSDQNSLYDALVKQIIEAYFGMPYRNLSEKYFLAGVEGRKKEIAQQDSLVRLAEMVKKQKMVPDLKAFTGVYTNELYGTIELKLEKGNLNMYMSQHPNNIGRLSYLGNDKFLCVYSDITCGEMVFPIKRDASGKPIAIDVRVNDFIDYLPYTFLKN
ncbi:MAG: serine hydrolase [Bacteroidia bacterium]|nr:serine hydrolase [Bacteroidia bacterium]